MVSEPDHRTDEVRWRSTCPFPHCLRLPHVVLVHQHDQPNAHLRSLFENVRPTLPCGKCGGSIPCRPDERRPVWGQLHRRHHPTMWYQHSRGRRPREGRTVATGVQSGRRPCPGGERLLRVSAQRTMPSASHRRADNQGGSASSHPHQLSWDSVTHTVRIPTGADPRRFRTEFCSESVVILFPIP